MLYELMKIYAQREVILVFNYGDQSRDYACVKQTRQCSDWPRVSLRLRNRGPKYILVD